jgi:hypothetical protein
MVQAIDQLLIQQLLLLEEICMGFSDTAFHTVFTPGKWTPHQNLAHLARYQWLFHDRVQKIRTHTEPVFSRYIAEYDFHFQKWEVLDRSNLLLDYKAGRKITNQLLHSCSRQEWERKGIHPIYGALTLKDWFKFFILHESHHMYTIFRMRSGAA